MNAPAKQSNLQTSPAVLAAPCLRLVPSAFNSLYHMVQEAAFEVQNPELERSYRIRPGEAFPARHLLVLLAYCYCNGTYFSRDVEDSLREMPVLKGLFQGELPDWKTLRRFRRIYRQPLRECLQLILQRALDVRFGDLDGAPADSCVAQALDQWFEPLCFPSPEQEALDRIERAALVDGMLLD